PVRSPLSLHDALPISERKTINTNKNNPGNAVEVCRTLYAYAGFSAPGNICKSVTEGVSMLENCQSAKERWGGVSEIIDRWLRERQELIVRYCHLTSLEEFSDVEEVVRSFTEFCQILLDYVSAGHFEVYEQLLSEAKEFNDGGVDLANKLYPEIQKTTEAALDFNDRF